MAHLTGRSLPANIAIGMVRRIEWDNEIIVTDGGYEVRNVRWSSPLRAWDISMPTRLLSDTDQLAVAQLWLDSRGGVDTFDHVDPVSGDTANVRFDTDLSHQHNVGGYYAITQFTIKEVRG